MNEGHSAAWDQQWDKAAEAYRKALEEFPDHPKALSNLGLALYQLQRYEEALDVYRRMAQVAPEDPLPVEKIAQLSERLGNLKEAISASMQAADLYLKSRDIDKAIENWVRVTQLNPEHIRARSRLALAHERLGHIKQAIAEYLAIASLVQRTGNLEKAAELVNKALQLDPENQEARQAQSLLKAGQLLPKPLRPKGGTGPIRMAQVKQLQPSAQGGQAALDPIAEARQKALTKLAEILFDYTDESESAQQRRGLQAIVRGTGQLSLQKMEQAKVVLHLSQAIDAQTRNQTSLAAEELEQALAAGFSHPALYFDLGLLRSQGERLESALRHLQHAVKHNDFALATRLLMGNICRRLGRLQEAAVHYLEALKLADAEVLPKESAEEVRQLYEPLIEAQKSQMDEDALHRLCDNIHDLLVRPDWQATLLKAREQLPQVSEDAPPLPLAEILIQAQSSRVLEAINRIHQLARAGHIRSAMDEAFQAISHAPTYLPLHTLIGDLLLQDNRTQDAITKFFVVAQAYSVRGEANQAIKLLRRVIQLAPMDLTARTRLIDLLIARGQVDDAIAEYLDLADIYYRLAELDMARK
ncbi:MAG: tetratricopeptide repeat protein, partial [Anaerolineae bacterium]